MKFFIALVLVASTSATSFLAGNYTLNFQDNNYSCCYADFVTVQNGATLSNATVNITFPSNVTSNPNCTALGINQTTYVHNISNITSNNTETNGIYADITNPTFWWAYGPANNTNNTELGMYLQSAQCWTWYYQSVQSAQKLVVAGTTIVIVAAATLFF